MSIEWYEVDLRDRKTGNSVECIYSGPSHDEAYAVQARWFQNNMPEWDTDEDIESLVDGSDGVFADVYFIQENMQRFGVGKIEHKA